MVLVSLMARVRLLVPKCCFISGLRLQWVPGIFLFLMWQLLNSRNPLYSHYCVYLVSISVYWKTWHIFFLQKEYMSHQVNTASSIYTFQHWQLIATYVTVHSQTIRADLYVLCVSVREGGRERKREHVCVCVCVCVCIILWLLTSR